MTVDLSRLSLADRADLEQSLAHALRFDGRRHFHASGEMMAKITAAHLVEQLLRSGYVVMKKPATAMHSWPPAISGDAAPEK